MVVIDIFLSWFIFFILPIIDLRSSLGKPIIPTSVSINLFLYESKQ